MEYIFTIMKTICLVELNIYGVIPKIFIKIIKKNSILDFFRLFSFCR